MPPKLLWAKRLCHSLSLAPITCRVCRKHVPAASWYAHGCFVSKPRQVWVTPLLAPPSPFPISSEDRYVLPARNRCQDTTLVLQRLWDDECISFKMAPVRAAAHIGKLLGFDRFVIASCGSAGLELQAWCDEESFDLVVYVPDIVPLPKGWHLSDVRRVRGGWSSAYAELWQSCSREQRYPVFPSGDPWYLATLRLLAQAVLGEGYGAILVPAGSGVHLLAYMEEAVRAARQCLVCGVQVVGNDPLVARIEGRVFQASQTCMIPSLSSQSPVNMERIVDESEDGVVLIAVTEGQVVRAEWALSPQIAALNWRPDRSLYAALAAAADHSGLVNNTCILSTGRSPQ